MTLKQRSPMALGIDSDLAPIRTESPPNKSKKCPELKYLSHPRFWSLIYFVFVWGVTPLRAYSWPGRPILITSRWDRGDRVGDSGLEKIPGVLRTNSPPKQARFREAAKCSSN